MMARDLNLSKTRKALLIIIGLLILLLLSIQVAHAYYTVRTTSSETLGTIKSNIDCIDISYSETGDISLNAKYPVTDEYALANFTPVTVTVTNNCTSGIDNVPYVLALTTLSNGTGYIPDNKVKTSVKRTINSGPKGTLINADYVSNLSPIPTGNTLTYLTNDLTSRNNVNYSSYTSKNNYYIDINSIGYGKTNTYEIYLWIDYYEGDTTQENINANSTQNSNFKAAVSLVLNSE